MRIEIISKNDKKRQPSVIAFKTQSLCQIGMDAQDFDISQKFLKDFDINKISDSELREMYTDLKQWNKELQQKSSEQIAKIQELLKKVHDLECKIDPSIYEKEKKILREKLVEETFVFTYSGNGIRKMVNFKCSNQKTTDILTDIIKNELTVVGCTCSGSCSGSSNGSSDTWSISFKKKSFLEDIFKKNGISYRYVELIKI